MRNKFKIAFGTFPRLSMLALSVVIFSVILELPSPLLTIYFIDKVLPERNINLLNLVGIGLVIFLLLNVVSGFFNKYLNSLLFEKIVMRYGISSFDSLLNSYYIPSISKPAGYWTNRIQNEPQGIAQLFRSLIEIMTQGLTFAVGLLFIFYFSPRLFLLVVVILPPYIWALFFLSPRIKMQSLKTKEARSKLSGFIEESLNGFEALKVLSLEPFRKGELEHIWDNVVKENMKLSVIVALSGVVATVIASLSPIGVLWYGGYLVMTGSLTLGVLIGINKFLSYVFKPVASFMNINASMQDANAALERMDEIVKLPKEPQGGRDIKVRADATIRLEHLVFPYHSVRIFDDLNFDIKGGAVTAIVGESGCGKSTLLRIIGGLLVPESGRILFDGFDLAEMRLSGFRKQVCLIPQNAYLFSGSLGYNISIGMDIDNVVEKSLLDATGLTKFPNEYPPDATLLDYDIGTRGLKLSGGQRQRVVLARALVRKPKILLMDEVTSEIDVETEREILESIMRIRSGKTTVIVAHRISAIKDADEIVVLSCGKVVERGTHSQLLQSNGFYRRLWSAQIGENVPVKQALAL